MKTFFLYAFFTFCLTSQAVVSAETPIAKRTIIVPVKGVTEFTVHPDNIVRLSIAVMSGAIVEEPKITGHMKVMSMDSIVPVYDGPAPVGMHETQIELKAGKAGKVTVTVPVKFPNGPKEEFKYTITIQDIAPNH